MPAPVVTDTIVHDLSAINRVWQQRVRDGVLPQNLKTNPKTDTWGILEGFPVMTVPVLQYSMHTVYTHVEHTIPS